MYRVLVGKPEGRDHWGDVGVDGWIILGRICPVLPACPSDKCELDGRYNVVKLSEVKKVAYWEEGCWNVQITEGAEDIG